MPYATNGDVSIHYQVDGDGPAVVFCGDVGLGAWQFGWQHGAIAGPYSAVTVEPRGIGESDAPIGPCDIGDFANDIDAVLAAEGIRKAHLVGYGFGGMVALEYAMAASRPASLAVIGTPTTGDAYDADGVWRDPDQPHAIEDALEAGFSPAFREERPEVLEQIADWRVGEDASPDVFETQRDALAQFDVEDRLHELTTPALVLHGTLDDVCPPQYGETLAKGLPRGEYREIPGVGHFAGIEASRVVNDELLGWLAEHAADRSW